MAGFGAHDAKPNLNVHNNNADPLRYGVSASAASMVAGQPGLAPNKAETCAVLQRRYTDVSNALSAVNVNTHWQNWSCSSEWARGLVCFAPLLCWVLVRWVFWQRFSI